MLDQLMLLVEIMVDASTRLRTDSNTNVNAIEGAFNHHY